MAAVGIFQRLFRGGGEKQASARAPSQEEALAAYVVRDDPLETWREGCWQLFTFEASFDGQIATAVFAVGLAGRRPTCRAMLRRGFTGVTVLETPEERLRSPRLGRAAVSRMVREARSLERSADQDLLGAGDIR